MATKVLIVEDEDLVARLYQKALSFNKYDVETALGGVEGLKKVKEKKPDIVLLDIMMPGLNGMEVLDEIKRDPEIQNIPVVMLTNLSGEHDMELAELKGAADYWVKKDVNPKDLAIKIEEVLKKAREIKA